MGGEGSRHVSPAACLPLQPDFVDESAMRRYAFSTTVLLGTGSGEIDVVLTPYTGDADL